MSLNFEHKSYERHRTHYAKSFDRSKMESWQREDTTDYWRHKRMYDNITPIIQSYPESKWLTIGDGRFGTDAHFILSQGIENVLATDISDTYLKIAKEEKFIKEYQIENAEKLSFNDSSFDFVLCKESYHHFPRPMVALYEMIRVAKKGVILLEPQDHNILTPSRFGFNTAFLWAWRTIKNIIKKGMAKEIYYSYGNYEEAGNYVYTISEREIEKVALGLNLKYVVFKEMNDCYLEGVEFEQQQSESPLFNKVQKEINKLDRMVKMGFVKAGLLIAVIFKEPPSDTCLQKLKAALFNVRELPSNPYV